MTTTHKADGLYAFALPDLDAKGIYACNYGRTRFARAVSDYRNISVDEAYTARVTITRDFMLALICHYEAACTWFAEQMLDETRTITYEELDVLYTIPNGETQVDAFMELLYTRALRERLITA
ncbi:hypothetical protein [Stenotrophomonas oahuensis]|uniref:Uncharacterized protein n=1 Tax=Stenotrophomonas oahuensis TaxID=3003271 RepID=A0ABY9YNI6_9GAMM|nr:hypothetical protein [Stenotrophomonas sp. A5586]WNH52457.1 hypothetical protein PDM29_19395 [Stenotrophomonas sp. A5586]